MKNRLAATGIVFVALCFIFAGERIAPEGTIHQALSGIGGALLVGALVLRFLARSKASKEAQTVEGWLMLATGGVALAMVAYGLQTGDGIALLGLGGDDNEAGSKIAGVLAVLWPTLLVLSIGTLLFMEMAYQRMPVPEAVEMRRVRAAAQGGASLALCIVFLASANYVVTQRDVKRDLSYFKTTHPSESTLRMVRGLGEPIRVILFYPRVNEVLDQLKPYFSEIDAASNKIEVLVRDHALSPELARDHRIRENGMVLLLRGEGDTEQAESFEVGLELEAARSRLRTLDGRFQQAFSRLTTVQRLVYTTSGHQELTPSGETTDAPGQRIRELDAALKRSNIQVHPYGLAEGLGNQVPPEAPVVMIIGPRDRFLPEEVQSLIRYFHSGGRIFLMVDPDIDTGLTPLIHALGIQIKPGIVESTTDFYRRTGTAADRENVLSKQYSSHPAVTTVTRASGRAVTAFARSGAIDRYNGADVLPYLTLQFPVTTPITFYLDVNANHERDESEAFDHMQMMGVMTVQNRTEGGEEGRAVVILDGDFASDALFANPGNVYIVADVLQWFLGEEQIVGDTSSEEDVRIEHTRDEDKAWFWATSFGVPLPLLGLGIWVNARRKRKSGKGSRV